MTRHRRRIVIGVLGLLLCAAASARAQVGSLGKGWLLDSGSTITSAPGEVLSGSHSIKASAAARPDGLVSKVLRTDPSLARISANQRYTMTWRYHIVAAAAGGFGYGFESQEAGRGGVFGPGDVLQGASGSSGTVSSTFTLGNYSDYLVQFSIAGAGSIVIDDVRITDASGQLVASENAEGVSLAPGPLSIQVTDATTLFTPAEGTAMAAAARDLDGDGHPETLLTLYGSPDCGVPMSPLIIESSGRIRLAASEFFPAGVPTNNCTPMIRFADLNNDGLTDIVFADAGLDAPPFTGNRIGVALNAGDGTYRDVTALIPATQQATRSYATDVGDIDGDGHAEIILPDGAQGANTALLRWNGSGFDEIRNWIPQSLWSQGPANLRFHSWLELADFDRDGRLDLLVTGQQNNPNYQIVFGGPGGFTAGTLVVLPDGPFGHTGGGPQPNGTVTTAEVNPVLIRDFNNDGLPDIFAVIRNITLFTDGTFFVGDSTYQLRLNQGARGFVDLSPSPWVNLGRVQYQNLMAVDMDTDGFLDVVGTYASDTPFGAPPQSPQWGTTLFLNDGTGAFQLVDGAQFIGATTTPPNGSRWGLGSFVPTVVTPGRTEGIVYQTLGGCGTPGGCAAVSLNLFKVVANGTLGTGPHFVDPATLGVPGFNEFYYLRHYPDAAAAVQAGQYASGLAHYLAVGRARGYLASAAAGIPTSLTASVAGSSVTLSWAAPPNAAVTSYLIEAGSASGLTNLARVPTGSTATSFSTSGVPDGTYYVRVKTISGTVTTGPSNEVLLGVGPGACTAAPSPPGNLTSAVTAATVLLRWGASSGSPQSYVLEAGSSPGLSNLVRLAINHPATSFAATSVASGRYYVRVRAANACGISNPSNEVDIVVPSSTPVGPPTSLTASVAGSTVTLSWAEPATTAVTSYLLEAGSAAGLSDLVRFQTGSTATSFSTSGVPPGTYYVRLKTISGALTSGPSNEVVVTVE